MNSRIMHSRTAKQVAIALLCIVVVALVAMMGFQRMASPAGYEAGVPIFYDSHPPAGASEYAAAAKWDRTTLTYSARNCPRSLNCDAALQAVRESVEAWDAASGITLNEISGEADINILWASGAHGDGNPFDGPGRVLAHAFFPLSWLGSLAGDVHIDDDETWVVGQPGQPWEIHLVTTVMHEVGHSLGLDHSSDRSALMYNEYTGPKGLGQDDIAGIQSLYGPPNADDGAGAPPPPGGGNPPVQPTGITATAKSTLRLRTAPNTTAQQLGTVPFNATVPVFGKNAAGDWLYVEYNGVRGWVAGWYCQINGDINALPVLPDDVGGGGGAAPTPVPGTPSAPTGVTAHTTSNTRMRSGPDTSYAQIGTIPAYLDVVVLGRNSASSWLYVEYNGQKGWIAAWLVTITGDLATVPVVG
jgi:uncharacterized protein YraI